MAFTSLKSGTWGTAPPISYEISYEKSRSGVDMYYKFKIYIGALPSSRFGYNIKYEVYLNGASTAQASGTIKGNDPSSWKEAYEVTTSNIKVANKTSGTTPVIVKITTNSTGRSDISYSGNLSIIKAKSLINCDAISTVGGSTTIKITRYDSSYRDTISYKFNDSSWHTIATKTSSTSISWTMPKTEAYQAMGATNKKVDVSIKCETYSGTTLLGSDELTFTSSASKTDCTPTLSASWTVSPDTTSITGSAQKAIQNYSTVAFTISPSAKYSATIASYSITCGTTTKKNTSSFSIVPKETTVTYTITDSRGFSNSGSIPITIVPYSPPTAVISASTPVVSGEQATYTLTVKGSISKSGISSNGATLYVKQDSGIYIQLIQPTVTSTGSYSYSFGLNYPYNEEHNIKVKVEDILTAKEGNSITLTALPVFDWSGTDFHFRVPVSADSSITANSVSAEKLQTTNRTTISNPSSTEPIAVYNASGQLCGITPANFSSNVIGMNDYIVAQGSNSITDGSIKDSNNNAVSVYKRYREWKSGYVENWVTLNYQSNITLPATSSIRRTSCSVSTEWLKPFDSSAIVHTQASGFDRNGSISFWVEPYSKGYSNIPKLYICKEGTSSTSVSNVKPALSFYAYGLV